MPLSWVFGWNLLFSQRLLQTITNEWQKQLAGFFKDVPILLLSLTSDDSMSVPEKKGPCANWLCARERQSGVGSHSPPFATVFFVVHAYISLPIYCSGPPDLVVLLLSWKGEGCCFRSFFKRRRELRTTHVRYARGPIRKEGEKGKKRWSGAPYFCFFRSSPLSSRIHVCLLWVGEWLVFVLSFRPFVYPKINKTSRHVNDSTTTTMFTRSFASWILGTAGKMEHRATFR